MATSTLTTAPAEPRRAGTGGEPSARRWWRRPHPILWGWLGLVGLHLALARSLPGFVLWWDGAAYFGNARWLAPGVEAPWLGDVGFYHAGYSVLLVPLVALVSDPEWLYRGAVLVNAAVAATVVVPLRRLCLEAFALPPRSALMAALAGAALPPVLLQSNFEWSESLLFTLVAFWAYAAWRLVAAPTLRTASAAVATAIAMWAAHPRLVGLVAVTALALAGLAVGRLLRPRLAAGAVAVLGAGMVAVHLVHLAMWRTMVAAGTASQADATIGELVDPSAWPSIGLRAAGQTWYLVASTGGLALAGVAALVHVLRAGGPRARLGAVLLAATATTLLLAVAGPIGQVRVDQLVYGRYNEPLVPVLVVAGLAALAGPRSVRRLALGTLAGSAAGIVLLASIVAVGYEADRFTGIVMPLNVLGVAVWSPSLATFNLAGATAGAALVAAGLGVLAARRPQAVPVAVIVLSVGAAFVVEARTLRPFTAPFRQMVTLPGALAGAAGDGAGGLAYDMAGHDMLALNIYQMELPATRFVRFDSRAGEAAPVDLVVARRDWRRAPSGAVLVYPERHRDQALWVLPGPRQDSFRERGFVVLEAEEVPPAFYRAELELPGPRPLVVEAGAELRFEIRVRHAGAGATWTPIGAPTRAGAVRVGARWDAPGRGDPPALAFAELPRALLPGMEAALTVRIEAVDATGQPLPPGRVEVRVGLIHEGVGWFPAASGGELTVPVEIR